MADELGSVSKDHVADSDGLSIPFSLPGVGVFTATNYEEECATDEPGSDQFLREGGNCQSVIEDC